MVLTANQKEIIHKHSIWLAKDAERAKMLYERTIDIAGRHEPKGDSPERWLLYLTNNVYIHQMTGGAHSVNY